MYITCCHGCESRQIKCHAHCETYLTQKILKIMVEAQADKKKRIDHSIANQKIRQAEKTMRLNHQRRRK